MKAITRQRLEFKQKRLDQTQNNNGHVVQKPVITTNGFEWKYSQEFQQCPSCGEVRNTMKSGNDKNRTCQACGFTWHSTSKKVSTKQMPVKVIVYT